MDEFFEISVEDLDIVKQLIELSAKNGSISPSCFKEVGDLYNKILTIISKTDSLGDD